MRRHFIRDPKVRNNATVISAVKAVYVDGLTSDYVTSTGLTIPQELLLRADKVIE